LTIKVALRTLARNDLVDAALWYEDQREGLSETFFSRIEEALREIAQRPQGFPEVKKKVRRALVKQFPYAVYFTLQSDQSLCTQSCIRRASPPVWRRRT
jgi:hypothetical protein